MHVPPHPHTGLQTVSWLFTGEIEHRDSIGSHAMVRPGELNPDDGREWDRALRGVDAEYEGSARDAVVGGAAGCGARYRTRVRSLSTGAGDHRWCHAQCVPRFARR